LGHSTTIDVGVGAGIVCVDDLAARPRRANTLAPTQLSTLLDRSGFKDAIATRIDI
jgi:hypothetical protein